MRGATQTATITVLLAIALATTALGSAASPPAGNTGAQPPRATVSEPASPVQVELPSSSEPTARDRLLARLSGVRSKSRAGAVLVIPSAQMKPEDTAALIEDMTIMSRIFERKLADNHLIRGGYRYYRYSDEDPFKHFFSKDIYTTEAIYVGGFGSLFLIDVDFALLPPPQVQASKPEDATDRVWATTRDELYNPAAARRRKREDHKEQYNAEKVDDLQTTLIKTLKHAANIRGLKAEESVTLMVRGSDITVPLAKDESPLAAEYRRMTGELTTVQPTFLTICAKKADIDSFSKNELDYDQFRQQIRTLTY